MAAGLNDGSIRAARDYWLEDDTLPERPTMANPLPSALRAGSFFHTTTQPRAQPRLPSSKTADGLADGLKEVSRVTPTRELFAGLIQQERRPVFRDVAHSSSNATIWVNRSWLRSPVRAVLSPSQRFELLLSAHLRRQQVPKTVLAVWVWVLQINIAILYF